MDIQSAQSEGLSKKNVVANTPKTKALQILNNQEKFFTPLALNESTISTGRSLAFNHAGKTLELGRSGLKREVFFSLAFMKLPQISGGYVNLSTNSNVSLSWQITGDEQLVDHFIIMASRPGYTYPSCVAHHVPTSGKKGFYYIDKTQYKVPGYVSYAVIVVYTDFNRTAAFNIGGILVN